MELLEQTKQLCRLYNIKPARSKGQNFLIKEEIYDRIVAQAELKPDDVVLEVGPGLGFLTAKLAAPLPTSPAPGIAGEERADISNGATVRKVIAVEIDRKLAEVLKIGLMAKEIKNVEVMNEDILKFSIFNPPDSLPPASTCEANWAGRDSKRAGFQFSNNFQLSNFKIVANLPYNITSIFLRKFLSEAVNKPELMVLMLQKEVAERITAKPGQMSLLAVSVQFYADAQIVEIVPKKYFWPEPEVDSAIITLTPNPSPTAFLAGEGRGVREFFRLVKFGFSAKRKMLKNNLAAGLRIDQAEVATKLKQAGFNEKIRAQELSVDDWLKLFTVLG